MNETNTYFIYSTKIKGVNKRDRKVKEYFVTEKIHKKIIEKTPKNIFTGKYTSDRIFFEENKWFETFNHKDWKQVPFFEMPDKIKQFKIDETKGDTIIFMHKDFSYHCGGNDIFSEDVEKFKSIEFDNKKEIENIVLKTTESSFLIFNDEIFIESKYPFLLTHEGKKTRFCREDKISQRLKIENNDKWNKFVEIVHYLKNNKSNFLLDMEYRQCFDAIKNEFDSANPAIMQVILNSNKDIYYHKIKDYLDNIKVDFIKINKKQNENYSQFGI